MHVSRTHRDCHGRVDISGVSAEKKRKEYSKLVPERTREETFISAWTSRLGIFLRMAPVHM